VTAFAHDEGIGCCELFIEPWNEASKRSARAAGYRPVGVDHKVLAGERKPTDQFIHMLEDRRMSGR
jgi:RimJ/RimL family protein N-acetyltransferase